MNLSKAEYRILKDMAAREEGLLLVGFDIPIAAKLSVFGLVQYVGWHRFTVTDSGLQMLESAKLQ